MKPVFEKIRPCLVRGAKAFYHGLYYHSSVLEPSMMVGGHPGGVVAITKAIVELENGAFCLCDITDIRFTDTGILMNQYYWPCDDDCSDIEDGAAN